MTKIQAQLEKSLASARALAKVAGEDCCADEKGSPEKLIDGVADVQVVDNLPEGVTVPGSKGMEVDGETSEDRGTDIGTVPTNGPAPEDNKDNPEVEDILKAAEHVTKHASAMIEMAEQILAIPDTAFAGVAKTASAGVTKEDVMDFIVKQANAGDPAMQGILNYCAAFYKYASGDAELAAAIEDGAAAEGTPEEAVAEGGNVEAEIAKAHEIVASTLKEQDPSLSDEEAQAIAAQAITETLEEAGAAEGGAEKLDENLVALVTRVAAEVQKADPSVSDEEAADIALQSIAEIAEEGGFDQGAEGVEKEASAEKKTKAETKVEKKANAEADVAAGAAADADAEAAAAVEDAAVADDAAAAAEIDPAEVQSMAEQLVMQLAEDVKAEDPSISDEEAIEIAAESVEDALETVQAQQLVGAADENGNPVVSDEDAAAITDELEKSASAYPCRALLCDVINSHLGLSPEAFAARIGA